MNWAAMIAAQVELFVQENPDLKEELDLLLQTRLVPDDAVVFDKKEQLIKDCYDCFHQ